MNHLLCIPSLIRKGAQHFNLLCLSIIVLFCALLTSTTSCGTIDLPDDPKPLGKTRKVTIHTRSVEKETVALPIEVVAFSESGQFVAHQRLTKADDKLTLSLPEGRYRLVAFSGVGDYAVPGEGVTLQSELSQPNVTSVTSATALMRGEAEVEVGQKRNVVDILLGHTMCAVEFRLSQIPTEVTQVRVRLSSVFGAVNWEGRYVRSTTVTLPAQRAEDGTWSTGVAYIFPTTGQQMVATISLTDGETEHNYAYTLHQPLTAGTPYRFYGAFKAEAKALVLEGCLKAAQWKPLVEQNFSFGAANSGASPDQPEQPSPETPKPSPDQPINPSQPDTPSAGDLHGFPKVGTLWKGKFLVAAVHLITADEADVMLLAKDQLEEAESANSTQGNADDASRYAAEYKEDGEIGWTVPTEDEARILVKAFHDESLKAVNKVLVSVRGTEIYDVIQRTKVKFLCNEGKTYFSFVYPPQFRKASATGHSYVVRLIKHVRLTR